MGGIWTCFVEGNICILNLGGYREKQRPSWASMLRLLHRSDPAGVRTRKHVTSDM